MPKGVNGQKRSKRYRQKAPEKRGGKFQLFILGRTVETSVGVTRAGSPGCGKCRSSDRETRSGWRVFQPPCKLFTISMDLRKDRSLGRGLWRARWCFLKRVVRSYGMACSANYRAVSAVRFKMPTVLWNAGGCGTLGHIRVHLVVLERGMPCMADVQLMIRDLVVGVKMVHVGLAKGS